MVAASYLQDGKTPLPSGETLWGQRVAMAPHKKICIFFHSNFFYPHAISLALQIEILQPLPCPLSPRQNFSASVPDLAPLVRRWPTYDAH